MRYLPATILLCLTMLPAIRIGAQIGENPPVPPSWSQRPGGSPTPNVHNSQPVDEPVDRMLRQQKARAQAKQLEQAKQDAAKLLELATDLKKLVDASSSTSVSAKTAPEADKIVKLAKSIKTKMRPL